MKDTKCLPKNNNPLSPSDHEGLHDSAPSTSEIINTDLLLGKLVNLIGLRWWLAWIFHIVDWFFVSLRKVITMPHRHPWRDLKMNLPHARISHKLPKIPKPFLSFDQPITSKDLYSRELIHAQLFMDDTMNGLNITVDLPNGLLELRCDGHC